MGPWTVETGRGKNYDVASVSVTWLCLVVLIAGMYEAVLLVRVDLRPNNRSRVTDLAMLGVFPTASALTR